MPIRKLYDGNKFPFKLATFLLNSFFVSIPKNVG
jgi:hypothetical protein